MEPSTTNRLWVRSLISATAIGLLLLAGVYLFKGTKAFVAQGGMPSDIGYRHNWTLNLYKGAVPWDDTLAAPDPPWATWLNLIGFGAQGSWTPVVYALLFVVSLVFLSSTALREARREDVNIKLLLAAGILACSSICTTLGLGQNIVFVTALLAFVVVAENRRIKALTNVQVSCKAPSAFESNKPVIVGRVRVEIAGWGVATGVALGISLAKPNVAALFILPLLMRRSFIPLVVAGLVCLSAMLVTCVSCDQGPVFLLRDWIHLVQTMGWPGYAAWQYVAAIGVPARTALMITAAGFALLAVISTYVDRRGSLVNSFAIVAIAGRLWSYHQLYDNFMLALVLWALGKHAVDTKRLGGLIIFALVGMTLWLPGRACDIRGFQIIQMLTWVMAGGYLSAMRPRT